jgi:hypothetical protein
MPELQHHVFFLFFYMNNVQGGDSNMGFYDEA